MMATITPATISFTSCFLLKRSLIEKSFGAKILIFKNLAVRYLSVVYYTYSAPYFNRKIAVFALLFKFWNIKQQHAPHGFVCCFIAQTVRLVFVHCDRANPQFSC
jgi:hypothetical protein